MVFGLKYDLESPNGYRQGVLTIVMIILTWPFVIIRIAFRHFFIKKVGLDDYFMMAAQILFTAYCSLSYRSKLLAQDANPHDLNSAIAQLNLIFVVILLYTLVTITVKLSLGFFYLRALVEPWQHYAAYLTMALMTVVCMITFWVQLFSCGNPKNYGKHTIEHRCLPWRVSSALLYTQNIANIVADLILMALPMTTLWSSKMNTWTLMLVIFISLLAGSGTISSILRVAYVRVVNPKIISLNASSLFSIFSIIEPGVFIIAGCMAAMGPLIGWTSATLSKVGSKATRTSVTVVPDSSQNYEALRKEAISSARVSAQGPPHGSETSSYAPAPVSPPAAWV